MDFFSKLSKIIDKTFLVAIALAQVLLVCMVAIVFANVVLRYVFNSGIQWSEEIVLVIIIWFTFIAMALGVQERLHININVLPKSLPAKFHLSLYILRQVLQTVLASVMFYYGILLTINGSRSVLPATKIPNSINYLVVPIAGFFIFAFSLRCLFTIKSNALEIVNKENGHA